MTKLTEENVAKLFIDVPGWEIIEEQGIKRLQRIFRFSDFKSALAFTNWVGDLAEREKHHPRIVTEWGSVTLTFWSHEQGGLVEADFEMAAMIDSR